MDAANDLPETMTSKDIARYMRLSEKTVLKRLQYGDDFPKPLRGTKSPKLWLKSEIRAYLLDDRVVA